jgi:hypothetical protein
MLPIFLTSFNTILVIPEENLPKLRSVLGQMRLCGIVSSVFPYIKPVKNGFAAAQKSFLLAVGEPFFTGYSK